MKRFIFTVAFVMLYMAAVAQSGNIAVPKAKQVRSAEKVEEKISVRFNTPVTFPQSSDNPMPNKSAIRKIRAVVDFVNENNTDITEVAIVAFCGYGSGSDSYALKKALFVAQNTKEILVKNNVDETIITIDCKGKTLAVESGVMIIVCNGRRDFYEIMGDFLDSFGDPAKVRF